MSVFEHFLNEFDSYAISKNELYDHIEKLESNGSAVLKTIHIDTTKIDENISLVLITPEGKPLHEEGKNNMLNIASKVAFGDKFAIQQILQTRSEGDIT